MQQGHVRLQLLGCQGAEAFRAYLPQAFDMGLSPVEAKELVYQAVAYLGMGRVFPFFKACNEVLKARGADLPLPPQGTVDPADREAAREAGTGAQVEIFGEGMREFWDSGSRQTVHLRRWLASWCFGGFYTRKGLTLAERELATFCFIAAQGGCESQLASHAKGNMQVGNGEDVLVDPPPSVAGLERMPVAQKRVCDVGEMDAVVRGLIEGGVQ